MQIRHRLITGLTWRVEARAASLSPAAGARVRDLCGRALGVVRAHDCLPAVAARAAILCFHGIGRRCDPEVEEGVLPVRGLRTILNTLRRSFRVIALAELVACLRERRPPPPRAVVLTFDDGYANNAEIAAGELDRLRLPWSAFLPAGLVEDGRRQWVDDLRLLIHRGSRRSLRLPWEGRTLTFELDAPARRRAALAWLIENLRYLPEERREALWREIVEAYSADELAGLRARFPGFALMSWAQARQLRQAGVDIGSHGLSHIALAPQTPRRQRHELQEARRLLQLRLGADGPHFSYPYGRPASISPATEAALAEMGYACGLTLEQDTVRCDLAALPALPRLIVPSRAGRILLTLWQRFAR